MKKRVLNTILCLAFLALAAPAGAAETLNVGKGGPQAFQFSPLDIGMEEGIFQKHGVDVKSAQLDSAAKVHQALAAGDVDLALASGPDMAFIAKGSPARSVAAMASQPSMLSVVVAADSPITAPAGLKGRKLSVTSTGSLTYWLAHRLSLKEGWGLDGIDVVALGAQTAQLAALRTHQTDAMVMDLTAAYKFEEAHDVRIIASFGDIVPDFHMHVIHATDAIIAKNPDAVRRFLAGWFDTIAYMRTHRADTVRIVARVVNVPEHIADRAYDVVMPVMSSDGCFDPKALATLRRSYVEMGLLDKEPDMSRLYTEAYLPAPCKH
ncbi:MAG TPA: ABC transporter substrate-binding protein [Stellaceae bacterium]|nr:ABC transporter substrate-binding protein [Stellaceae bacterium]